MIESQRVVLLSVERETSFQVEIYVLLFRQMCGAVVEAEILFCGEGVPFQLSSAQNNPMSKWHTLGWHISIPYKHKCGLFFPRAKEGTAWMCLPQRRLDIKGRGLGSVLKSQWLLISVKCGHECPQFCPIWEEVVRVMRRGMRAVLLGSNYHTWSSAT